MTPEFDRQSAVVLGSPYFWGDDQYKESAREEHERRMDELHFLRDAIDKAQGYDKLPDEAREIWKRAKAAQDAADDEYEEKVKNDTDGYGRFHETITGPYGSLVDKGKQTPSRKHPKVPPSPFLPR